MQDAVMNIRRQAVTFNIEVVVPFDQAADFHAALTGDDNDIVLAAEAGMRARLEDVRSPGDFHEEEVELFVPEQGQVKEALHEALSEYHRTHGGS